MAKALTSWLCTISEAISTYLIGHYISSFYLTIDFSSFQIGLNINFLYKTGIIFLAF